MKKILLILLLSVAVANWNGRRWEDSRFNFTLEIPGTWETYTEEHRHRLYAGRGDESTEVYVNVFPANNRTAEEVARAQLRAYDSWQYKAGAHLTGNDRRGASTAFSAMYERAVLKRATARTVRVIVQEGYFVRGENVYILTITTDSDSWSGAKRDILQVWNSFRLR